MEFLLFLGFAIYLYTQRKRLAKVEAELELLSAHFRNLKLSREHTPAEQQAPRPKEDHAKPAEPERERPVIRSSVPLSTTSEKSKEIIWSDDPPRRTKEEEKPSRTFNFEQQFGARLPVWIGGLALALSGFYLVRYSIDKNLLTEPVRVILGFIFSSILLGASHIIRKKDNFANGTRISQALAGAGIAVLYASFFSASSLYHLIPSTLGFIGMALTTGLAVVLSLRHGAPIALLGLLGGFATPSFVSSESPSALVLFTYLYVITTGLFIVIRHKKWWLLSILLIIGCFAWVLIWLFSPHYAGNDSIWLGLFVLGVSALFVGNTHQALEANEIKSDITGKGFDFGTILSYATFSAAIFLLAGIAFKANFGALEWGMFGLISLGSIVLARFHPKIYGYTPWIALVTNILMLAQWSTSGVLVGFVMLTLVSFALLFGLSSLYMLRAGSNLTSWAGLLVATTLSYFLLAYNVHKYSVFTTEAAEGSDWINQMHFWGGYGIFLAAFLARIAFFVAVRFNVPDQDRQKLLAIFTLGTSALISLALTIELDKEYISVAIAAQILATAWVGTKLDVHALRTTGKILLTVFWLLLASQLAMLFSITLYSLFGLQITPPGGKIPLVEWPWFQLGFPMVFLGVAAWLFRQRKDGRFIEALEVSAIALGALLAYYMTRHVFHVDENILFVKAGFFERGVMTNVFFAAAIGCLWAGKQYVRRAFVISGSFIFFMALFRVFYFDMFLHNPVWSDQLVGELPILNSLWLPYAFPLFWIWVLRKQALPFSFKVPEKFFGVVALLLIFVFVPMQVRQMFWGADLSHALRASSAEIYSYSAAWLALGLGLLFAGTIRKNQAVRIASLVLMILTIGKVFLYDASQLTGLFRVFSFMGLGLSLIGLSWFYSRFVFKKAD